jgi:hypothetical protein
LLEVELKNYLGIYISKDTATAVCVDSQGKDGGVVGCFSVRAGDKAETSPHLLASLISQGCAEREWQFAEVSVALDCAMFMQHNVHSEFTDPKQIAATVRFDTEEALATDVSDVAITFQISSTSETGSELTVFTAKKKMLSDVLASLQSGGMDPMSIEPDVNCLSRYVCRKLPASASEQGGTIFGVLSTHSGYLMAPHKNGADLHRATRVRTFLVGAAKNRDELLTREVLMTTALIEGSGPISRVRVFDSAGVVDCRRLGERLGIETEQVDLADADVVDKQLQAECANPVDFAIACGAAWGHIEKAPAASFRDDYMPYQGKKIRLQKALKYFSVSFTVLLIAVGLYFQTQLFGVSKYQRKVRDKFAADYLTVILNPPLSDGFAFKDALKKLKDVKKQVEKSNAGPTADDEAAASKLTLVLDAFNKSAGQTDLSIKTVSITERSITIIGDTSSRGNTMKFFATVKSSGLAIVNETLSTEAGRDKFRIGVEPVKK